MLLYRAGVGGPMARWVDSTPARRAKMYREMRRACIGGFWWPGARWVDSTPARRVKMYREMRRERIGGPMASELALPVFSTPSDFMIWVKNSNKRESPQADPF